MTDSLNLIIREIKDGQQRIEYLKSFLQPKTVNEITIVFPKVNDKGIMKYLSYNGI
ncbi:hypothetical protein [Wolbachia endosymbiont (group B) of Chesias legatella]|uniref:hypothetical protein n=1 Tax=Wolbachia endosymbiont (group B) of Chesias legatella TaxID=3066167 RepID=UPI0031334711